MQKSEIRMLLHYYWNRNLKVTEAAKRTREVEGEGVISNRRAQNWFQRFDDGDTSLEGEPDSGLAVCGFQSPA
jgi:hypothetical protein